VARAIVALIRLYQLIVSPMLPPACRFYPSCSQYALVAVRDHGVVRGVWLGLTRLARCHPWNPGGVDFVPSKGDCRSAGARGQARPCI
jgi:uncharacterized protein